MKKLLHTFAIFFVFSMAAQAQPFVSLVNNTPCTVIAELRAFTPPGCAFAVSTVFVIPPGTTAGAAAPAGSEWIMARFGEPLCAGSGALIEAPIGAGCTFCTFGLFPAVNVSPGCACPAVTGTWDPCAATITFT